jgi:serine/threonine-protein kinase RsbW
MDTRFPLRILARNDEARLALEKELLDRQLPYVVTQSDPQLNSPAVLEMPSELAFLEPVTNYLTTQLKIIWSISTDQSLAVAVALQEALVNAIKHGNHNDPAKRVRIIAEISVEEARFIVEDEGKGFEKENRPNPLTPTDLYKTSGRGMLLINSIMDETEYNQQGNVVTMIKKRSTLDQPSL